MAPSPVIPTELLTEILSYTDMTDLLCVVPLVCKRWNEIVRDTPRLQEMLFFKPIKVPEDSELLFDQDPSDIYLRGSTTTTKVRVKLNPLLVKHFGKAFFRTNHPSPIFRGDTGSKAAFESQLSWSSKNLAKMPQPKRTKMPKAFKDEKASWRRMLVSQPPPPPVLTIIEKRFLGRQLLSRELSQSQLTRGWISLHLSKSESLPEILRNNVTSQGLHFGALYDLVQSKIAPYTMADHVVIWGTSHSSIDRESERRWIKTPLPKNSVCVIFKTFVDSDPLTTAREFDRAFRSNDFHLVA